MNKKREHILNKIHLKKVNLLDWRSEFNEKRKYRFFFFATVSLILGIGLSAVLPYVYYGHLETIQSQKNNFLESKIKVLNNKEQHIQHLKTIKKNLVKRMKIIKRLQKSRSYIVHYFKDIKSTVPQGAYLQSINQKSVQKSNNNNSNNNNNNGKQKNSHKVEQTTITGVADSNGSISKYMVNLNQSKAFSNPRLIFIKKENKKGKQYITFKMVVQDTKNMSIKNSNNNHNSNNNGSD